MISAPGLVPGACFAADARAQWRCGENQEIAGAGAHRRLQMRLEPHPSLQEAAALRGRCGCSTSEELRFGERLREQS